MDVWLVWLRDGEWGDTNLMDPAHRSREAAMAWCNENRKLVNGDPVQWTQRSSGGVVREYNGSSAHCVTVFASRGRRELTETRFYSFQVNTAGGLLMPWICCDTADTGECHCRAGCTCTCKGCAHS